MSILKNPQLNQHAKQVLKFCVSGGLGAVIEFTVIHYLVGHLHWSAYVVYIPSALLPSIFVFFFNKYVTFGAMDGNTAAQTKRFLIVYTSTFCLNYVLSSLLYLVGDHFLLGITISGFTFTDVRVAYAAKICAIGFIAIVNYTLSHTFIFKNVPVEAEVAGIF